MIEIAELVKKSHFPGNYFSPDAYVQGDYEIGLLENRSGARLIALPDTLMQAIYVALDQEVGQATGPVLYNCGRWWGKNFYRRFTEEISEYYDKPLAQMEMIQFIQCLKQCWQTNGWGVIDFDFSYYDKGFLVVSVRNSAFAEAAPPGNKPICYAEAGILSAFFSQLTGQELHCQQTTCESMGADVNHFVLGLADRIKSAQAWLEEGQDHQTIMDRLCRNTSTMS